MYFTLRTRGQETQTVENVINLFSPDVHTHSLNAWSISCFGAAGQIISADAGGLIGSYSGKGWALRIYEKPFRGDFHFFWKKGVIFRVKLALIKKGHFHTGQFYEFLASILWHFGHFSLHTWPSWREDFFTLLNVKSYLRWPLTQFQCQDPFANKEDCCFFASFCFIRAERTKTKRSTYLKRTQMVIFLYCSAEVREEQKSWYQKSYVWSLCV